MITLKDSARRPTLVVLAGLLLLTGCAAPRGTELNTPRNHASWTTTEALPGDLRVVSFNLRRPVIFDGPNYWGFRKHAAADMLRQINADIVGVQECVRSQAIQLEEQLPDYAWIGAGRNDGKQRGEMTAIFYRTARLEPLDHGHFWFADDPTQPGKRAWGAWWPRMATWVRFRDRHTAQDFYAFNAHLDAVSANARQRSAELLAAQIETIAGSAPVVVLGDFNTGADTQPHRTLTQTADLHDAVDRTHEDDKGQGTRHKFLGGTAGERIDWVLHCDALQTRDAGIVNQRVAGRFVSDHFPVVADLSWNTTLANVSNDDRAIPLR